MAYTILRPAIVYGDSRTGRTLGFNALYKIVHALWYVSGAARRGLAGAVPGGRDAGAIRVGAWADLMALDCSGPDLAASQGDMLLDSFIFAGDDRMVSEVWSAGRHIVTQGRHAGRDGIIARYRATIARLREAL